MKKRDIMIPCIQIKCAWCDKPVKVTCLSHLMQRVKQTSILRCEIVHGTKHF